MHNTRARATTVRPHVLGYRPLDPDYEQGGVKESLLVNNTGTGAGGGHIVIVGWGKTNKTFLYATLAKSVSREVGKYVSILFFILFLFIFIFLFLKRFM